MRRYTKLFGLYFLVGFGYFQNIQNVQARPYISKASINHTISTQKITSYYSRQKQISSQESSSDFEPTTEEKGLASWYPGRILSGHGDVENRYLTAAHPTLPFGTKVLVYSEDTGCSVLVTINDRGPFIKNRVIDLSRTAAIRIGMFRHGVAHVTVTPITNTEIAQAPKEQDSESKDNAG